MNLDNPKEVQRPGTLLSSWPRKPRPKLNADFSIILRRLKGSAPSRSTDATNNIRRPEHAGGDKSEQMSNPNSQSILFRAGRMFDLEEWFRHLDVCQLYQGQ
jgi:hypothetical protein